MQRQQMKSPTQPLARIHDRTGMQDPVHERWQRIQNIRRQIREGTYAEQPRINAILDRVAADLQKLD